MQPPATPAASGFDARKVQEDLDAALGVVRRGWRLIGVGLLITLTAAAFYVARSKTLYRSTARLLVIEQGGRPIQVAGGGDPFQAAGGVANSLGTHLMLIKSPVIVGPAVSESGLNSVSVDSAIGKLTAKVPDASSKVIDVTYAGAATPDEARLVMEGVIRAYDKFLKDKYQKNNTEVIGLIARARDELNLELKQLEKAYLEYRQKNPAYSADDKGRSFIARRLDQWDQAMNQVLTRSLQLKAQLELGRKLAKEGVDPATRAGSLGQVGVLGGGSAPAQPGVGTSPVPTPSGVAAVQSLPTLQATLAEVVGQRETAEVLLDHLRRELEGQAKRLSPAERARAEAEAFAAIPEVAEVQASLRSARTRLAEAQRLVRSPNDPSVTGYRKRIQGLQDELDRLWEHHLPDLEEAIALEGNAELRGAIQKAEADLVGLRARESALKERVGRVAAEQVERLRRERDDLLATVGPAGAGVADVQQRLAEAEAAAEGREPATPAASNGQTAALLASLERGLESVEAMRRDLQAKFEEDLSATKKTEITQLEEANLRDNLDRQKRLFNSIVDQLKQAQLVSDYSSIQAQTINPPSVAAERPNPYSIFALAVVAGCGLGVGGAFAVELLDGRVRTLAEIRRAMNLPLVGIIPQLSAQPTSAEGPVGLLSHRTPRSSLAESYKSTRTNLEFLRRNRKAQVLLVTSPHPSDGKSTTASNLAITLAHAGRRVLLIDADLRKPSLHAMYGLSRDHGLSDLLELPDGPPGAAVIPTFVPNLDLITTGPSVSNPAELLASDRLQQLLDAVRSEYDLVIVDSSPLLAVTDPSIVAAVVDAILLVVRLSSTRRHDLERTVELVRTLGIPVLGMVVNGVTTSQIGYGRYGYGYGRYGYGYGRYGYGSTYGNANGDGAEAVAGPGRYRGLDGGPSANGSAANGHLPPRVEDD